MSDRDSVNEPRFRPAVQEVQEVHEEVLSPQTQSAAYRLAFQDDEFLLRPDLRPVRFQLELLKPELLLDEAKIASTFVFYGSARIPSPEQAQARIDAATDDQSRRVAERLAGKSHYYEVARDLARISAQYPVNAEGCRNFVVCSAAAPRSWKRPIAVRRTSAPRRSA